MSSATEQKKLYSLFKKYYNPFISEAQRAFYSSEDMELFFQSRFEFVKRKTELVQIKSHHPSEHFPWLFHSTVIEIIAPATRFSVTTLQDYLDSNKNRINLFIHPVFSVIRNSSGELKEISLATPEHGKNIEIWFYIEIPRQNEGAIRQIETQLKKNFRELEQVTQDYPKAIETINSVCFQDEENQKQLLWLRANFIILGFSFQKDPKDSTSSTSHYGILKDRNTLQAVQKEYKNQSKDSKQTKETLSFYETSLYSSVNQDQPLYLAVSRTSPEDSSKEELMIVGRFANRSESSYRKDIPQVNSLLQSIVKKKQLTLAFHTYNQIYRIAQILPISLLLTRPKLARIWIDLIISHSYSDEKELYIHMDPYCEMLWVTAIISERDADNFINRNFYRLLKQKKILPVYDLRFSINQNRLILIGLRIQKAEEELTIKELKNLLKTREKEFFFSWTDEFRRILRNRTIGNQQQVHQTIERYFQGIAPEYQLYQEPEEAIYDLSIVETLDGSQKICRMYLRQDQKTFLKIYSCQELELVEIAAVLRNFGLKVHTELIFPYHTENEIKRYTYAFHLAFQTPLIAEDCIRIADSIEKVLNQMASSETIDSLVIHAKLDTRELSLIKCIAGYYFQIDKSFSIESLRTLFLNYPDFSRALVDYFHTRLSPQKNNSEQAEKNSEKKCEEELENMSLALDESLGRNLKETVSAVVRTNFYSKKNEITLKIESSKIENMPLPKPLFEIYVYSRDIEGIHLRSGRIARGGIRWSDRQDDFRTEVLGLMKAQMVKNTVIVPRGSKGGFVLKKSNFSSRKEFLEAGKRAYQCYISNLLELTDNLLPSGKVEGVKGLRVRDPQDTYLVVAADKGTALFSNMANEISVEKKFWLGDAFASGGAQGYDHKKQGITAKGAWESVRRHFYEKGIDPDQDLISVIGIGDMGGDVFGNGMLLSKSIKLTSAFNHLYIFLDPNPDPKSSYQERERLFASAGNWNEYSTHLISKGGGVFDRNSKKITLSQEVKKILDTSKSFLSGEELIRSILASPADLLWNGGVGTYVKAQSESHFQAQDPSNNRVRISSHELRAKVVGEGGNLGLTQAARIEACMKGINLNTDAIDNSAGVDMSDHEVNLKILLNDLLREGKINDQKSRNQLIRSCEKEEIRLVLAHNQANNIALSLDERRVPNHFTYFRSLIKFLNREGLIDRQRDSIPFEADLDHIEQEKPYLPRPVLCSLMGFTKLYLTQMFEEGSQFYDSWYDRYIFRYFPQKIVQRFQSEIKSHPLKREIIITELVNDIVNHAGISYFQNIILRTQKHHSQIAKSYMILSEFLGLAPLRNLLLQYHGTELPSEILYEYLLLLEEKIFHVNLLVLSNPSLEELLLEKTSSQKFLKIHQEAFSFAPMKLSKSNQKLFAKLSLSSQKSVRHSFQMANSLEDSFFLFMNQNSISSGKLSIKDYYHRIESFEIHRLRELVHGLPASAQWEAQFVSRIESKVYDFTVSILGKGVEKKKSEILRTTEQIFSSHKSGNLSSAMFYEMLTYVNSIAKSAVS